MPAAHECNVQQLAQRVSAVEGSIGGLKRVAQDAQRGVANVRREGKRKAEELHQELDMVRQQAEGAAAEAALAKLGTELAKRQRQ